LQKTNEPEVAVINPKRILVLLMGLSLVWSACGSDGGPSGEEGGGPVLPVPGDGFQMRSVGLIIEPGEDVEYCEVGLVPGDEGQEHLFANAEVALSGYSHHLILYAVEPGSEADGNLAVGDILPCTGVHHLGAGLRSVGAAQQPYLEMRPPPGVGRRLIGGQKFLWNYHHLNTSTEPVMAGHAFNVHTVDSLEYFAKSAAFANRTIDVPPGAQGEFTGECFFNDDVQVAGFGRHTHRWGTDFDVWFAGGERDGEHIWTSTDFELDVNHAFEAPFTMKAGEGFRFRCAYDNTTDTTLRFGNKATDEMCILFSSFWESSPGQQIGRQSCVMSEIGDDGIAHGVTVPDTIPIGFD